MKHVSGAQLTGTRAGGEERCQAASRVRVGLRLPGNPPRRRERPGSAGAGGCELPAPPLGAPAARDAPRKPRQQPSARGP